MSLKGSIVIAFSGRRYLMVRHSQRGWEFPGGRPEPGESPLETARRELAEETGLAGTGWRDCGIAHLENGDLALFTCRVSGKPSPDTDEIDVAGYFTAPPMGLSFARPEYFQLLRMAGWAPKRKTDYDIASREFDRIRKSGDDSWIGAILEWGHISGDHTVLDIGCGTGRHSVSLMDSCGADVMGMDSSAGMLEKANSKARGMWLRGDAAMLPFRDRTFDRAMLILVLQHLDDEPMAISEARRVLEPGGRLLIATISHSRIRRHVARLFPGLVRIDLDRFMPVPELMWHLREQGFAGVRRHIMRTGRRKEPMEDVLDRFRKRYISTLALVPDGDFEARLAIFEGRLRERYGDNVETDVEITFIEATKF